MNSYLETIWTNIRSVFPALNTSVSSIAGRIVEVCATFMDLVRLELLRSEQTIADGVRKARITTASYAIEKAFYYQEGDNLVVIDQSTQELVYENIDELKQIIKQASLGITSLGIFYLNVATADSNNNVVPLTQAQLDAFRTYYQNFVGIGVQVSIASNTPAILTADNLYIRYNGTYNLDNIKQSVNTGLHDIQVIRRSINRLYINEIESYLVSLPGIDDAYFRNPVIQYDDTELEPVDGSFELTPGYFNFDPALYDYTQTKTIFQVNNAL